jgi:hypothetical protein
MDSFMTDLAARTFRNAIREARIVLCVWFLALIWTVGYCYVNGYRHDADNPLVRLGIADEKPAALTEHLFGMPRWVCWGIFAPAVSCSLFTLAFGLFGIADDPLGFENEEEEQS